MHLEYLSKVKGWSSHVASRYPMRELKRVEAVLRAAEKAGAQTMIVTEPTLNKRLCVRAECGEYVVEVDVVSGQPYRMAFGKSGQMVGVGSVSRIAEVAITLRLLKGTR